MTSLTDCDPSRPPKEAKSMDLFSPLTLRGVQLRNRIGVSPMCQYSATDGVPDDWHLVHLVSRAVGGAGLVMAEATGVVPEGRITPGCTGLWNDTQQQGWARITRSVTGHGAVPAIQLGHAGRKSSTSVPWEGDVPLAPEAGGWTPVGPSAIPFTDQHAVPHELGEDDIEQLVDAFRSAARRALDAGFRLVELHGAHGYLMHSFHSPLANHRTDRWGGDFAGRTRFTRTVARAVREVWPDELPLAIRLSATDWTRDGWTVDDSVALARVLVDDGVDLVDASSGGIQRGIEIPTGPGYQVDCARRIRAEAGVATAAVGMISEPAQANEIVTSGAADLVLLAREMLRDPYWPRRAAVELGRREALAIPRQYLTAWPG